MTATVTPIGLAASRAKHPSQSAPRRRATDPVTLDATTAQLIASILLDPMAHNDDVIAGAIDLLRGEA